MTLHINGQRVETKNLLGLSSNGALNAAWERMKPSRHRGDLTTQVKALFWLWGQDNVEHIYDSFSLLSETLEDIASGRRRNYFFEQEGEHRNIHTVIHTSVVPQSSIGLSEIEFFEQLGHERNACWGVEQFSSTDLANMMNHADQTFDGLALLAKEGLRRRAEQEYLLQNMVKGAMFEAAEIADRFGMGIAVRGTGLLAHMGIESGNPTKSQEFKNKTSKEADLWLCNELNWRDLGVVVHYDPRVAWSSANAAAHATSSKPPMFRHIATQEDWRVKWAFIRSVRRGQLSALNGRINQIPNEDELKKKFFERSKEYMEEDYDYRRGHYAPYTALEGPHIRLKIRRNADMVGDHDLFLFTQGDEYGSPAPANVVAAIQTALQSANTFQAQHGGIWYWEPTTAFNKNIKDVIMRAHGPDGAEPLVYLQPGKRVSAAYFIPEENRLRSVWDCIPGTKWMGTTHSGSLFLNPPVQ